MDNKRNFSGLSDPELMVQALDCLREYRQSIDVTEKEGEGTDEASTKTLDEIIAKPESRLSEPQVGTPVR